MSDIIELKNKIEEAAKALHDERKHYEELKAEQAKGRISEGELKARIEKLEKMTDKIEDQKANLEKLQAAVQRIGNGAEGDAESKGVKLDRKAFNQGLKMMLKTTGIQTSALNSLPEAERKALSNSIMTDGGFRVVAEKDNELTRILYDTSNLRAVARVVSIGSNRYEKVGKDTLAGAVHTSELASKSLQDSATTFMIEIPVHEIYSWQGVTEQHLEDAQYDVMGETMFDAAQAIALGQNTAFITGSGLDRAKGITTYTAKTSSPSVYARGQVGTIVTASATTTTFDELMDVQDTLKTGYLPGASWLMNRATRAIVRKLKYSSGTNEYIWELSTQVGVPSNMLGNPVQIMDDMPSMAASQVAIVFGDIRQSYTIVDRVGLSLLDDPYTGGNIRYLKYRARYGGGMTNFDGIKYLKMHA